MFLQVSMPMKDCLFGCVDENDDVGCDITFGKNSL